MRLFLCLYLINIFIVHDILCIVKPTIGIVSQELNPKLKNLFPNYSSFILATYVKAVESSGALAVPVLVNQSDSYYSKLLSSINGLVLPGGESINKPGYPYYDTVSTLYKLAKELNTKGIMFPVLGVCLGFEFLITAANNGNNILKQCDVFYENLPLIFLKPTKDTKLYFWLHQNKKKYLQKRNATSNWHRLCLSEYDFEHSNLKEDWKITALSKSSKNKKFIASIESKKFPFFGIQFHPEKIAFDFYENEVHNENIPHSLMDILVNRYFYDILVEYGRKSNNTFNNTDEALASSIYNYRVTYDTEYNKFHPVYLF